MSLSEYPFCHGDRGEVGRSRIPIARKSPDDDIAIDAIPIANDISWRLLPAVGFGQLTGNPMGRSGVRSHLATEARGGNAARSEIHTTAETRSSGLRTNPSTQCRRHDCAERSSSPARVAAFSWSCFSHGAAMPSGSFAFGSGCTERQRKPQAQGLGGFKEISMKRPVSAQRANEKPRPAHETDR